MKSLVKTSTFVFCPVGGGHPVFVSPSLGFVSLTYTYVLSSDLTGTLSFHRPPPGSGVTAVNVAQFDASEPHGERPAARWRGCLDKKKTPFAAVYVCNLKPGDLEEPAKRSTPLTWIWIQVQRKPRARLLPNTLRVGRSRLPALTWTLRSARNTAVLEKKVTFSCTFHSLISPHDVFAVEGR